MHLYLAKHNRFPQKDQNYDSILCGVYCKTRSFLNRAPASSLPEALILDFEYYGQDEKGKKIYSILQFKLMSWLRSNNLRKFNLHKFKCTKQLLWNVQGQLKRSKLELCAPRFPTKRTKGGQLFVMYPRWYSQ